MAPKTKAKAKSKAKAEAKAEAAQAKAVAKAGAPAAGSGTAAVKQAKLDAAAATEEVIASAAAASMNSADGVAAEVRQERSEAGSQAETAASEPQTKAAASEPAAELEEAAAAEAKAAVSEPRAEPSVVGAEADDEAQADAKKVDLSEIPDPWKSVGDEIALGKIKKEEWEVIETEDTPSSPSHLAACDADLSNFLPTEMHRQHLVSADFSGNSFTSIAALGGPLWLRALGLANNPLESLKGLAEFFPCLLSLDVSFIEISDIDGAWDAFAACPRLRRLNLEGCSIASFEDMKPMPGLISLEVHDNALETIEDVETLKARCPKLQELDLRENDVVTEGGYMKKVKALFPNLTYLDNQPTKAYVVKRQDEAYKDIEGMNKEINAVDGMWKNEGCSCLEGNPCLDPATCKDWKNREAVAAEARKRKGLRDDFGKLL